MYKYQEIIDALSIAEIESAIKKMVDNYNLTGKYLDMPEGTYDRFYGEKVFKKYFSITSDISNLIETFAQKDYDEEKYRLGGDNVPLEDIDFSLLESSTPEQDLKNEVIEKIYRSLLDYLFTKAKLITKNREYSRIQNSEYLKIPVGSIVDFHDCMLFNKYLDKVEFYKDGGWGIAEKDGTVLVRNHLMEQPSKTYSLYRSGSNLNMPYLIIQDRDTNKYGIISLEYFHETIHCLYDEIVVEDYYNEDQRHFIIMAKKSGMWGCYNDNCALKIECKYDDIKLKNGYLECLQDAESLVYETFDAFSENYVTFGKKDLYDYEGNLILGGYDELDIGYNYLQFYFGTFYEYYHKEDTDIYGYPCQLSKLRLNYDSSICLLLDRSLRTIIRDEVGYFRIPKGIVFNSLKEVKRYVPSCFLLRYRVDLSSIDRGFIYLHNFYGEQYIVPRYIERGFDSPEEMKEHDNRQKPSIVDTHKRIAELRSLLGMDQDMNSEDPDNSVIDFCNDSISDNFEERFIDDEIVTIIKLSEDMTIDWSNNVNEVGTANHTTLFYRLKDKIGIFGKSGLYPANYDAITWDSSDRKTYIASFEFCHTPIQSTNNPNFRQQGWYFIRYYKYNDDGTLIRMADDWNVFNPTKHKWFPYDFIKNNYGSSDRDSTINAATYDRGLEWTDEDAWDAMTDGMYGDYPGPGWDPEMFGY